MRRFSATDLLSACLGVAKGGASLTMAGVVLAFVVLDAQAVAAPSILCPRYTDPYTLSDAQLAACGDTTYPLVSLTALPGGGWQYNYADGSAETLPPPSFNAATASPSELAQYGIPPAPPADSSEYAPWQQMIHNIHFVISPTKVINVPESSTSSPNWSGYMDYNGQNHGGYYHSTAYIWQPNNGGPGICPNNGTEASFWGGIGGWNGSSSLGQDGTVINDPNFSEFQGWWQVGAHSSMQALNWAATEGYEFEADTQYRSGTYYFYLYNFYNGSAIHAQQSGSIDSSTAEYIAERPSDEFGHYFWLEKFGYGNPVSSTHVTMQGFTNNQAFTAYPYTGIWMYDSSNNLMAWSQSPYNSYQFDDWWQRCS